MSRVGGWLRQLVISLPDRAVMVLLCACLVVSSMLLLRQFHPYLAVVLTLVLIAATWRLGPQPYRSTERSLVGSIVACEFLLGWIWFNAPYFQQLLSVFRDPAVYALRGWWLTDHTSPLISMTTSLSGLPGVPQATAVAGAFPVGGDQAYPQGASLVPGLLAVAGRIGGLRVMLAANLIIGAVALLLVYAVARRLMGPVWGLIPMVSLAVSMPMVYFARASYTEPTALAAIFGGLLLLLSALETRKWHRFLLAGVTVGVATLARVDGVLAVDALLFGLAIIAAGTVDPVRRRQLRVGFVAFAVGGLITSLGGWYDLVHNSRYYYPAVSADMHSLFKLFAAVFIAGLILSFLPLAPIRNVLVERRVGLARAGAALVLVICAVMISRPLWWTAHLTTDPGGQGDVATKQAAQGLAVDGTRSYDEHSVSWMAWYLTWPVIVLAAIGLAIMVERIVRKRDLPSLAFISLFGVTAILYLNRVSITPDQVWGSRRLLPVILPAVVIAAAYAAYAIGRRARWRWLAIPLAVLVMIGPMIQWRRVLTVAEGNGELAGVNAMCAAISQGAGGQDRRTVFVGTVPATGPWTPVIRIICNSAVVTIPTATPAALAKVRANWPGAPVTVVTFIAGAVKWATPKPPASAFAGHVDIWNMTFTSQPKGLSAGQDVQFWVGTLGANGTVSPLS